MTEHEPAIAVEGLRKRFGDLEALAGKGHGAEQMNTVLRIQAAKEQEPAETAVSDV